MVSDRQPATLLPTTAEDPDGIAVTCLANGLDEIATLSWAALERRARQFANGLATHGLGAGDRWAVLAHNRIEWAELIIGNGRAGCRYVPLNWHLTATEVAELIADSQAQLLVTDPENKATAQTAIELVDHDVDLLVLGDEYEAWLAAQPDEPPANGPMGSALLYTGGTTGRSKGVTRSDFSGSVENFPKRYDGWGTLAKMPERGVMAITTPIYHALGSACLTAGLSRNHAVFITNRFDPIGTLALIDKHQITTTPMVPAQFIRLLKLPDAERATYDVGSLQWVLHTAAPCPPWAKREMIEWFGPVITELYGSSEGTGPVIATSEEWLARPGTVGQAQGTLVLSVVDDDGNDLGPGEVGTIYVKRLDGAPSYHEAPEKTAASRLPDGRFTVGDVGWLDEDGFLFLADRRVDLILVGGSNVYPAEIEGVLSQHPSVADVAVFGIPDDDLGQAIKAVVEPPPGVKPDVDDIMDFAGQHLAKFKLPASIDVTDALPREAHGKLKKRLLRDPYWPS